MNHNQKDLIFIYNAKNGIFNELLDYAHKILSPETYDCSLCKLTYNNFGKIRKWKEFLDSLHFNIIFTYKNNLKKLELNDEIKLPAVLLDYDNLLISSVEINMCNNLDELMQILKSKIESI